MALILHIDDDANDRELTCYHLGRVLPESEIVSVRSGQEGLDAIESREFDCIICDFQMPGLNGLHVLREVRTRFGETPFIFLTGQGNEEIAAEALRSGANDYFTKGEGMLHYERLANSLLHHIAAHELKNRQSAAQKRIEHLNLVLQAIRGVNRIITKSTSAPAMLEKACKQLVETRGYRYSWIALLGENSEVKSWTVAAKNGSPAELKQRLEDGLFSEQIEKASRQGGVLKLKDVACVDKDHNEWCNEGLCSVLIKRLSHRDTVLGVICVALPFNQIIDDEETNLFSELVDDLALALGSFEHDRKRQHAEKALQETTENLNAVIAAAPGAIGLVIDRNFIWVSKRMEEMLGYSAEELIGRNARMLYQDEESFLEVGRKNYDQISKSGVGSAITKWVCKDGSVLDIFLQSSPIDPDDLSRGVTFVGTDITETTLAQERAELHETTLKSVLEALPAFVHIHSADFSIKYANDRFKENFGNPDGRKCYEIIRKMTIPCEDCNTKEIIEKKICSSMRWQSSDNKIYQVISIPVPNEIGEIDIMEIGFEIEDGTIHPENQLVS